MNKETAELLAAVAIVRYMMDDCLTSNETPQKIRSAAAQADVALKRVELEIYRDVGKTPPQRNREDINKINKPKKKSWFTRIFLNVDKTN